MTLRFAYDTSGTVHHRLLDAIHLIKDAGYDGIGLTLDIHHLDPFSDAWLVEAYCVGSLLEKFELGSVVSTGAPFLLDARVRHEPTLVSADAAGRTRRIGLLKRAIDIAQILKSEAVSLTAGIPKEGGDRETARAWLVDGLRQVSAYAEAKGVVLALEPAPASMIETLNDFSALDMPSVSLAFDPNLCHGAAEPDLATAVTEFAGRLGTVAINAAITSEAGRLPFGEADGNVAALLDALDAIGFNRLVCVKLPHESHRADVVVSQTLEFLRTCRRPGPGLPAPDESPREIRAPGLPPL